MRISLTTLSAVALLCSAAVLRAQTVGYVERGDQFGVSVNAAIPDGPWSVIPANLRQLLLNMISSTAAYPVYGVVTPSTGAAVTVSSNFNQTLIVSGSTALNELTVQMPLAPQDGQQLKIQTAVQLNTLWISPQSSTLLAISTMTGVVSGSHVDCTFVRGGGHIYDKVRTDTWFC